MLRNTVVFLSILGLLAPVLFADDITVEINCNDQRQTWDGFGVNYVETAQTPDYQTWPQEYGGFGALSEADNDNNSPWILDQSRFDHATSTEWIRYFVREGLKMARAAGHERGRRLRQRP